MFSEIIIHMFKMFKIKSISILSLVRKEGKSSMKKIKRKKRNMKQEQTFHSNEFRCFYITANECSYCPEK